MRYIGEQNTRYNVGWVTEFLKVYDSNIQQDLILINAWYKIPKSVENLCWSLMLCHTVWSVTDLLLATSELLSNLLLWWCGITAGRKFSHKTQLFSWGFLVCSNSFRKLILVYQLSHMFPTIECTSVGKSFHSFWGLVSGQK